MKLLKYAGFVPYLAIAFINASVDLQNIGKRKKLRMTHCIHFQL